MFKILSTHLALSFVFSKLAMALVISDGSDSPLSRGVNLVDWNGMLANPVVKLNINLSPHLKFPVTVSISGDDSRMYFNLPSRVSERGPTKEIRIERPGDVASFFVGLWPDRDSKDEKHKITISAKDSSQQSDMTIVPVFVKDKDLPDKSKFQIHLDFSHDKSGFFKDPEHRRPLEEAAADWAHFIDDMELDQVKKGMESTYIWDPDHLQSDGWKLIPNDNEYTGFLLYITGNTKSRSGGGAGSLLNLPQTRKGQVLPLMRSGSLAIGPTDSVASYLFGLGDADWWKFNYAANSPVELLSLAQHEMGHALFFCDTYPVFKQWVKDGQVTNPNVVQYEGKPVLVDKSGHFPGAMDKLSHKGLSGSYQSDMPNHRWITTKAELLLVQGIGYKLRNFEWLGN